MTTKEGQLTWAAKRAIGMASSVEANERRRLQEPPIIDGTRPSPTCSTSSTTLVTAADLLDG